jgi:vacuolar-type H+-ATPase subunit I/STV1
MQTVLLIIALYTAAYALWLSIAITAVFVAFVLKLSKAGLFKNDDLSEGEPSNTENSAGSPAETHDLLCKLEEIDQKLNELSEMQNADKSCAIHSESESKLDAEAEKIRELTAAVSELEAENKEYYLLQDNFRGVICDAIDSLIKTKGSNSIEYYEECVKDVVKRLNDSLEQNK